MPERRTRSANARSTGSDPARASIRNRIASAPAIAASVCSCMRPLRLSGAASSRPAVSMTPNARSPSCARPSRRSRVTPGRSSTSARRRPTRRLNRVDLPTLGRPTMATVKLMTAAVCCACRYAGRPRGRRSARRRRVGPRDPAARGLRRSGPGAASGWPLLLGGWRIRPLSSAIAAAIAPGLVVAAGTAGR